MIKAKAGPDNEKKKTKKQVRWKRPSNEAHPDKAENGKANAALLKLLARAFRLPARDFAVLRGASDRRKVVAVSGAPGALMTRIMEGLRPWSRG